MRRTAAMLHTRFGILNWQSAQLFPRYTGSKDIHEGGINAALHHRGSHDLHEVALPQVDVHVRRRGQLEALGRLNLHFGRFEQGLIVFIRGVNSPSSLPRVRPVKLKSAIR